MSRRELEAELLERGFDADPALLDPPLGHADDIESWEPGAELNLDLNGVGVDSDKATSVGSGEHAGGFSSAVPRIQSRIPRGWRRR